MGPISHVGARIKRNTEDPPKTSSISFGKPASQSRLQGQLRENWERWSDRSSWHEITDLKLTVKYRCS